MQRIITLLLAVMAVFALAAPTPKALSTVKLGLPRIGSFKATTSGRRHRHHHHGNSTSAGRNLFRNPRAEMERAYRKFNWAITFVTPNGNSFTLGLPDSSSTGSLGGFGSSGSGTGSPSVDPTNSAVQSGSASFGSSATYSSYPSATSAASGASSSGEVSATPEENESEYLSPVKIGGQTLNLDFDTGSADLWVFSSDLPSSEKGEHAAFDPSKSSTWQEYPEGSWKIQYGDGSGASGTVGFDTVNVGGATATRQAVELATQLSSSFVADENNDGLLGLAFSTINTVQPQAQKTFFESIIDDLDQPLFTADLEDDAAGTYEFGAIDSSKYSGDIHYTKVDSSNGFWEFPSTSYSIGGQTVQSSSASSAIADTGTSLLLVDDAVAEALYKQIEGSELSTTAGGYVYPCDADVPDFGVQIGDSGFMATIPGKDISFAEVGAGTCFGGVQGNGGQGMQIFGDVLLKQYFAVFNGKTKEFGLAKKN